MADLTQVERLREKVNVTFAEAKEALDASDGDLLEALIYLEQKGKADLPEGGGFFSSETNAPESETGGDKRNKHSGEGFWDFLKRCGRFLLKLIDKGNNNYLDATKNGEPMFSCPITALIILLVVFCYITVPLIVISLFCGIRYRFRGDDLGRESVNKVMDTTADAFDGVKKTFTAAAEQKTGDAEETRD